MATSKRLSTGRGLETIKEQKKRPYYHSSTNLPVENTEEQYDSDEFVEMSFLTSEIEKRLDEFTIALSESERNLLKMWNRHVMADRPLAIAHYKNSLLRFIKLHDFLHADVMKLLFMMRESQLLTGEEVFEVAAKSREKALSTSSSNQRRP